MDNVTLLNRYSSQKTILESLNKLLFSDLGGPTYSPCHFSLKLDQAVTIQSNPVDRRSKIEEKCIKYKCTNQSRMCKQIDILKARSPQNKRYFFALLIFLQL